MFIIRAFFLLHLLIFSVSLVATTCDDAIIRFQAELRYISLNPNATGSTVFDNTLPKKIEQFLQIPDDKKFYETVTKFLETTISHKFIIRKVERSDLDTYISLYPVSLLKYKVEEVNTPALEKYNEIFNTDYKELPEPDYQGMEGFVYRCQNSPNPKYSGTDLALKVWVKNPEQFNNSSLGLEILYNIFEYHLTELQKNIYVVKTLERGPNYILREFYNGATTTLVDAIQTDKQDYQKYSRNLSNNKKLKPQDYKNPAIVKLVDSINMLTSLLLDPNSGYYKNPLLQALMYYMRKAKPSENLLWDPETQRIIIVDTPGY